MPRILLLISFSQLLFISLFSQQCSDYYKLNCLPKKSSFTYNINNLSSSFLLYSGDKQEIAITLESNKDYRLTICADSIFDNVIQFIILNNKGVELYNNSVNDFKLDIEFLNKLTQDVIFEISTPEQPISVADTVKSKGCIGVLIEEMVTVKTGF